MSNKQELFDQIPDAQSAEGNEITKEESKEQNPKISAQVIKRLPRYFRYLRVLLNENALRISSNDLAERMHVTASQIRQDLNCFGGFGQQGYGYNVATLYGKISEILGVNENYHAIIIGAGKLGQALSGSPVFAKRGVEVLAMFDINPEMIGTKTSVNIPILDTTQLEEFCKENIVDIAVLTLPANEALNAAMLVEKFGVKAIWNFTSTELSTKLDKDILVQDVHMGDSLMMLCYDMKRNGEKQ